MNRARLEATMARSDPADRIPLVSIGLPVRNGGKYLAAAVDSLLGQTFDDFELIIRDNGSTDDTAMIARRYAAADPRVRFQREVQNTGAAANFNSVFRLARGQYFKWAAHDDVCAPHYLERCLDRLEVDRRVVLCHTVSDCIDGEGRLVGQYSREESFTDDDPCMRFDRIIHSTHLCIAIFGVARSSALARTPLIGSYVGSDRNLLAELALMGRIVLIDDPLFQRRDHPEASIRKHPDDSDRLAWFDPRRNGPPPPPTITRIRQYRAAINRVPLSERDRMCCREALDRWCRHGRLHTGEPVAQRVTAERARNMPPSREVE